MNLLQIKELYKLLTVSDNIFDIRNKLHNKCDKVDFDLLRKEYLASDNIMRMINYIKKEYDAMIEAEKTAYKISDEELEIRINKLKKVDEIFKTYDNPYIRFDKMSKLFKNPSIMHKSYILLIRYGKDDHKLDEIRPLLDIFDTYYREFRDSFKNDIHQTVAYAYKDEQRIEELKYAEYIILEYIKSNISFKFDEFLEMHGITEELFNSMLNLVKFNNRNLYYEYVFKTSLNDQALNKINEYVIDDLNYAINNDIFIYGNNFDLLEFIKLIPFKEHHDFLTKLDDFMALHNINARENILTYIKDNELDKKDAFKLYNEDDLYNKEAIINNTSLDKQAMNTILHYLKRRNIPLYKSAIVEAGRMYIDNLISKEEIKNPILTRTKPIIIPAVAGTKTALPGVLELFFIGCSLLQQTNTSFIDSSFNNLRIILAKGSLYVLESLVIFRSLGLNLLPVPIQDIILTLFSLAFLINNTLVVTVSQASMI